jgi:hypothetical protein
VGCFVMKSSISEEHRQLYNFHFVNYNIVILLIHCANLKVVEKVLTSKVPLG